jgi:hypothetical protein
MSSVLPAKPMSSEVDFGENVIPNGHSWDQHWKKSKIAYPRCGLTAFVKEYEICQPN